MKNTTRSFDQDSIVSLFNKATDEAQIEFLAKNFNNPLSIVTTFKDVTMSERVSRIFQLVSFLSSGRNGTEELCKMISDEDLLLCMNSNISVLKVLCVEKDRFPKLFKQVKISKNKIMTYDLTILDRCARFMTNNQLFEIISSHITNSYSIEGITKQFCKRKHTIDEWVKALRLDEKTVHIRELFDIIPEEIQTRYLCKLYSKTAALDIYEVIAMINRVFCNVSNKTSLVKFFSSRDKKLFTQEEWEQDLKKFFLNHGEGYSDSVIKDLGCKLTRSEVMLNQL